MAKFSSEEKEINSDLGQKCGNVNLECRNYVIPEPMGCPYFRDFKTLNFGPES
jgi:hypothetical protein